MKRRPSELIFIIALVSFTCRVVYLWINPSEETSAVIAKQLITPNTISDLPLIEFLPNIVEFLPNTVLLSTTTTAFITLTKNLIMSLETIGLGKYLTVVCFEANASQSLKHMAEFTGRVHELGNDTEFSEKTHNISAVECVERQKIIAMKWYLSKGHNVLWIDNDIVVFRDFRVWFNESDRETYDAILQDGRGTNVSAPNWFKPCTGFMYIRASPTTLNFTNLTQHEKLWSRTRETETYLLEGFLPYWKIKQLPIGQFANEWWLLNMIRTRRRIRMLRISSRPDRAIYLTHVDDSKGAVAKARQLWRFGTFFYNGPGSTELLDLKHFDKGKAEEF